MFKSKFLLIVVFFAFSSILQGQVLNKSWRDIANKKEDAWFSSNEAKAIAENVLLYQRNIGGWPKNIQMQLPLSETKINELIGLKTSTKNVTTDNGATYLEMLFLSKVYRQQPDEKFKNAFLKGVDYLLEAQYENGGWPQFYPLKKGYYTHITYNDDSMVNILFILKNIKDKTAYFSIKPSDEIIQKVEIAFQKGINCILKTQYKQNGILTSWCAQHDEKTLLPAKARAYELPSLSGAESSNIVLLLMSIENPSAEIINAIDAAVAWFEKVKITGLREERFYDNNGKIIDKKMVADENASAIWARFMDLENNNPFFCDRDGIKKATLAEIGEERRNGYAWYKTDPQKVLDTYPNWKKNIASETNKKVENSFKVTVAKDGSGDYTNIQEAINNSKSFPYERITIFIKNGTYYEKIKIHEWNANITLVGESKEKTIITFDDYFDKINLGRNSTFFTPTLLVEANNVVLKNLTIENSSGEVGQAIALSVSSDEIAVINCKILGNQDTLYASGKGKQYYKDCYIEGTTDFIFGSATAFFDNCQIHSKKDSYITAASTLIESEFGYVFKDCKITADQNVSKVYLGRPWRIYAQTVFISCDLGKHVFTDGWHNWGKLEAEKTTFYAEYKNVGNGFHPKERVKWSHQLNDDEAKKYTLKNVLGRFKNNAKKEWYENL
ncbi:pectate lyase [uncultured Polaribacter sp.]|uniref:pectate lyase n=1 Tax=uncultured Polaribacter sp. TaxID=174711 RepID=UPI0030DA7213|tara:strand:- start:5898 stop:7907 length:2010 start_codon:yes stop_codon:yes gene_type:complete